MPDTDSQSSLPLDHRVSRQTRPADLSLEDWQIALRRQYGREQHFEIENLGPEPVYSDFEVRNPASSGCYCVSIRGPRLGDNRCTCPDFLTNELGTCKHIEFTLAWLENRSGTAEAFAHGLHLPYSEVWLQYGARRRLRVRPSADAGDEVLQQIRECFDPADDWAWRGGSYRRLQSLIATLDSMGHELRLSAGVVEQVQAAHAATQLAARVDALFPEGADSEALHGLLKLPLLPYQREGTLFVARLGRALLADDMGLGKTVQAIAATEIWLREQLAERVLIVCPTSLKRQWADEIHRFTGRPAMIVEGTPEHRSRLFADPCAIKIISYDCLTRDLDTAQTWSPQVLIVDEAQRIKNWESQAARALKRLHTRFVIVLCGTPLENRLEETLSIVQLIDRHRFGPTWRFLDAHQIRDDNGRPTGYRNLNQIGETLAPIMIRRRRDAVLDQLPERSEKRLFVPLTEEQRRLHDQQAASVAQIVARWRRQQQLDAGEQKRLKAALQRMRMVCDSSALLDAEAGDHGEKIPELLALLDERFLEPTAKAVIFSQWLGALNLLADVLESRGWHPVLFTGQIPVAAREQRIQRFHEDPDCRVLLASDTGSVGLNLQQAASMVIHLDPPWNPAVLEQRTSRVHRLGQRRHVEVVHLIAEDSIEQRMLALLSAKRALFEGIFDGGESDIELRGTGLARFMESVGELSGAQAFGQGEALELEDIELSSTDDPLQRLLGMAQGLLDQIALHGHTERDPKSGRLWLRLPAPEPDVLEKLEKLLKPKKPRR